MSFVALAFNQFTVAAEAEKKRASLNITERKRKKQSDAAPPQLTRSAVFAVQIEKKLIAGIDKTTSYLEKTARALPKKSAQRLQILERVLNLKMEQATYLRSEEERVYDASWRRWNAMDKNVRGKEPQLGNSKSTQAWKDVISASSIILKEYPRSKSADVVTFNQAVGLQYLGKEKDAARMYSQLIQNYPNSNVAGDAYTSLGDFYFDRNDFRNAQSNYMKATKFKRSSRYLWAVFKLGWCDYNLGNYRSALTYWKQLVSQARGNEAALNLKDEALRDMVYAFAELRDVEGAIAYYRANGGQRFIGPFLLLLGQILADQGNYAQSIEVYKRFQRVAPTAEEGPDAHKEVIGLYYALNKLPHVWQELGKFNSLYGMNSAWSKSQKKEVVVETQAMIKDQLLYYASLTHQKAIKDNNVALNKEARKGYMMYLQNFPKSKEVPTVKYMIADIEYFLKNYREAGRFYLEIASLGKDKAVKYEFGSNKGVNVHKEVSTDMVRSFVKDFEPEFKVLKKRSPDFTKPKPLSIRAKNYIKACSKYTQWYPSDKLKEKTCEMDITKIYYHSGHKPQTIKYLKLISTKYSKDKEGPASVELLIPMVKDDKKELNAVTVELLKIDAYRNGAIGKKLRDLARASEKEAIAGEKNTVKRAKLYEEQAKKFPNDPDADKLLYNAAVDYTKAGAISSAIGAYVHLVKRYPKSSQAQESLLQIAKIYEKQLEFDKSASYFFQYYKKYPQAKEAPGAFAKTCELLLAVNSQKSRGVCLNFAAKYPDGGAGYVWRMIKNAERAKDYNLMTSLIWKEYLPKYKLNPNQRIVALYKIYKSQDGQGAVAAKAAKEIEGTFGSANGAVEGEALRYCGELAFKRANGVMPKYSGVKLAGGSVDKLAASLEQKAQALNQVEQTYNSVMSLKDAYWGVAALYQMGYANEQYANMMENPPDIQGASKADVVKEIGPQIAARKKAAMQWYKMAQETVTKFKVYNEWSVRVINGLNRINDRNFTFEDYVVKPDFIGTEVPSSVISSIRGGN